MDYTIPFDGYSVLGTLGSTRVQFIYEGTNDCTERQFRSLTHFHIPHELVRGRQAAEQLSCSDTGDKVGSQFSMNDCL